MDLQQLRLLLVQATEPYRAGIESGMLSAEQLTVLEGLTTWGFQLQEVGILGCASDEIYDEILPTGVRVIGNGVPTTNESILKHLADFCPTPSSTKLFHITWSLASLLSRSSQQRSAYIVSLHCCFGRPLENYVMIYKIVHL